MNKVERIFTEFSQGPAAEEYALPPRRVRLRRLGRAGILAGVGLFLGLPLSLGFAGGLGFPAIFGLPLDVGLAGVAVWGANRVLRLPTPDRSVNIKRLESENDRLDRLIRDES